MNETVSNPKETGSQLDRYEATMIDAPDFDAESAKQARIEAYKSNHPDAVEDIEKARAMAEAGNRYESFAAAELNRAEANVNNYGEPSDDEHYERFGSDNPLATADAAFAMADQMEAMAGIKHDTADTKERLNMRDEWHAERAARELYGSDRIDLNEIDYSKMDRQQLIDLIESYRKNRGNPDRFLDNNE